MVYGPNEILHSDENGQSTITYNTDGSHKRNVKWKKVERRAHVVLFHLYEVQKKAKVAYRVYPGGLVTRRDNGGRGSSRVPVMVFVKLGVNDIDLLILQKCNRLCTDNICTFLYIPIQKKIIRDYYVKLLSQSQKRCKAYPPRKTEPNKFPPERQLG